MLDTNILLDDPNNIYGFDDNNVWITGTTLQELDDHKEFGKGDIKYNARKCGHLLDSLREEKGSLVNGVELQNGGRLFVEPDGVSEENVPRGFSLEIPDNRIISSCVHIKKRKDVKGPVILVTNDSLMRINADTCGVLVQKYFNDVVEDSGFLGYSEISEFKRIQELYNKKVINCPKRLLDMDGEALHGTGVPVENEFLIAKYGNSSALMAYRNGALHLVQDKMLCSWITPMNSLQRFMIYALMAPPEEIPLVIFSGPAGTAKTFLSLAAGIEQTYVSQKKTGRYKRVLISRPNVETDEGFGYLPGDLEEKMSPLLAPYYDNLETILRGKSDEEDDVIQGQIEDMFKDRVLEICPLSYIRGRRDRKSVV